VLVLTRRIDESLVIRDDIIVTVLSVEGDKVKLGIQAPPEVRILRQELCEAVRQQNLAAARLSADGSVQVLSVVRKALDATPPPPPPPAKPEA
jgi:carbon storage regulator